MKTLKESIEEYEKKKGKMNAFSRQRFLDGWFSWDDSESSEYDIWNVGRKAREEAENRR